MDGLNGVVYENAQRASRTVRRGIRLRAVYGYAWLQLWQKVEMRMQEPLLDPLRNLERTQIQVVPVV